MIRCFNYSLVIYDHSFYAATNFYKDLSGSIENTFLAIHKFPVVFFECQKSYNDTVHFLTMMQNFKSYQIYIDIAWNIFFNFADIYMESADLLD